MLAVVARWRETRALRFELRRALYDDRGCMLVVTRLTESKDARTSSFTCGTGARVTDRRIVKAFNMEYLKLAKGEVSEVSLDGLDVD